MFDLQKASMLKRASAWLLDVILLSVLATGFALLLSAAFGYDNYNDNLQRYYTEYEQLYGIDFNISDEEYLALGEEDRLRYADAYAKLNDDADVSRAFSIIIQLSLAIMSLSVLLAYMALEFAIPVLWLKNGQTIGKKIFGLAVMRTDSVRVKPIAMLIRTLLGKYTIETMAPLLIIFLILFYIGCLVRKNNLIIKFFFFFFKSSLICFIFFQLLGLCFQIRDISTVFTAPLLCLCQFLLQFFYVSYRFIHVLIWIILFRRKIVLRVR